MQGTLQDVLDSYRGRPILVIGGGPSAPADLRKLTANGFEPACVLSANAHGFYQDFYKPTYSVCADKIHCELKISMREHLEPHGAPILAKHGFADVRLPDWTFSGNTGLTCVAIAVALGGRPVVTVGLDCWQTGRRYFHGADGKVPVDWDQKFGPNGRKQLRRGPQLAMKASRRFKDLERFVGPIDQIRPMSGKLLEQWPMYNPLESLLEATDNVYANHVRHLDIRMVRVNQSFMFSQRDIVQAGSILALSKGEMQHASQNRRHRLNSQTVELFSTIQA